MRELKVLYDHNFIFCRTKTCVEQGMQVLNYTGNGSGQIEVTKITFQNTISQLFYYFNKLYSILRVLFRIIVHIILIYLTILIK